MNTTDSILIQPAPEETPSFLVKVWRVLAHPAWLGMLSALVVVVLAAHLELPQLPNALAKDPLAAATWMDSAASSIPAGTLFRALGLFDLAHHLALRVLLPLDAAILLLHLVGGAWRAWRVQRLAPPTRWLPGLHAWDALVAPRPADTPWRDVCAANCAQPRTSSQSEEADILELCDCHHRRVWLGLVWELGWLLALAVLLLNLYGGWQIDPIVLNPGQSVSLAPYVEKDIALSDDASQLTLCCPAVTAPTSRGSVRDDGVSVRVFASGQAVKVALLSDGRPVQLQAIEESTHVAPQLIIHFPESRSERILAAPEAHLAFRLVALEDGGVRVQALDADNQPLFSQDVNQPETLPVSESLSLQVTPTTYLMVRALGRPWTWLLPIALLLMLVGGMARWRWPYWRVGARINEAGAALRWQGPRSTRHHFEHVLQQLTAKDE